MSNNKDFKVKNGIQPTVYHEAVGTVTSGAEGYYLSGASYANKSFDPASQGSNPFDIILNNDGTKMYVLTYDQKRVYQYSLSTAYDISTASYDSKSFLFTGQDALPWSIKFNNDGTKMYMLGNTNDDVFQYSLSTAFDVSTASYDSVAFSIGQTINPRYLTFNGDGTKFYLTETVSQYIYEYSMSTAFDISTASHGGVSFDVSTQVAAAEAMALNADGTKMFVVDLTTDSVYQYSLSTAYDVSTSSYDSVSFSLASEDTVPRSIFFADSGTKMYIAGQNTDVLYQYTTEFSTSTLDLSTGSVFEITPTSDVQVTLSNPAASGTVSQATLLLSAVTTAYTITYSSTLEWPSGTAPTSPALGETDVLTFSTTDGGTSYQAVQAIDGAS
jgi:6-phosphogluconolactonase (cycloisomerase 2 family)